MTSFIESSPLLRGKSIADRRKRREISGSAPASTNANESGVGMIAYGLSLCNEGFCLLVGKAFIHNFENLLFGHSRVLQAADLFAGKRRQTFNAPVDDLLDSRIGKSDQFQRDRFAAEDVDLVGLRHFQNLGIRVTRT